VTPVRVGDLRVGQIVVAHNRVEMLENSPVVAVTQADLDGWRKYPDDVWSFYVIYDPPPEPIEVDRELFDWFEKVVKENEDPRERHFGVLIQSAEIFVKKVREADSDASSTAG
jgi:hypothetical protein